MHIMNNPLLPNPGTHPRLYAREYLRLRPLFDGLVLAACVLVGVPAVGYVVLWTFRLIFAL